MIVSSTVCLEAQHRIAYENIHGLGTFACRAAAPRKLRRLCSREYYWYEPEKKMEAVWDPKEGTRYVGKVLDILKRMGGAPTIRAGTAYPCFLPLDDWESYHWINCTLTPEVAARLICERGPCMGVIFCIEEYDNYNAYLDDDQVYTGCHRDDREELRERLKEKVGYHVIVCSLLCLPAPGLRARDTRPR